MSTKLPIRCMMGDSQAALYGHGWRSSGEVKATIGTGSSVMMNIGSDLFQTDEVVTSIGWQLDNKVIYVAEGNINYVGAVINWLIDDIKLLSLPKKAEACALSAKSIDKTYLVPAFSGLGAPYWKPNATAALTGMTRATGRNEIIKACLDSIGFQINDILRLIENQTSFRPKELDVDGGVTANGYLMQFISNLSDLEVKVPEIAEFSALGVALCAGQTLGIYEEQNTDHLTSFRSYFNEMTESQRKAVTTGWERAVQQV